MNAPHSNDSQKLNAGSIVYHDPQYIRFAYWPTLLELNENHPPATRKDQKTVFLKNLSKNFALRESLVDGLISIKNNCNSPVLNFSIYSKKAEEQVFKLPELPDKNSIRLEFNKEGVYELNFFVAGSTSFSKITFNVLPALSAETPLAKNFDWNLKSQW